MANNPPAIVDDFIGVVSPSSPLSLEKGARPHLKCSPQLKPPHNTGEELQARVSTDGAGHQASYRPLGLPDDGQQGPGHITAALIVLPQINLPRFVFFITLIFPRR